MLNTGVQTNKLNPSSGMQAVTLSSPEVGQSRVIRSLRRQRGHDKMEGR